MSTGLPETLLLIGGAGFLGSNLGQALMEAGCRIVVVDRVQPRWDLERYRDRGHYIQMGASSLEGIALALSKHRIDTVIHLASGMLPGSAMDDLCADITDNLLPGLRLFDLLQAHGVERFVFLSSGGTVYGQGSSLNTETDPLQPLNYYGWMKTVFEEFIRLRARTTPLRYMILRPSNPYGRYQDLRGRQGLISVVFGRILDQRPLQIWGDGSIVRDYLYIEDFCRAVLGLLRKAPWNAAYNVGSGQGASINDVVRLAREITGRSLEVEYLPSRSVDIPTTILDITRLSKHLDAPLRPLEEGMALYWAEIQREFQS